MQRNLQRAFERLLPRGLCAGVAAAWILPSVVAIAGSSGTFMDVSAPENLSKYVRADCKAEVVGRALKLSFGHAQPWPHAKFLPERLGYTTDWSGIAFLAVTVNNPTDVPVKVNVRVDSQADKRRGRQGGAEVPPGQTVRLLLAVGGRPPIIGMSGQPPIPYKKSKHDVQLRASGVRLDAAHITRFQIFMGRPKRDYTILVHRIALIPAPPESANRAFVDRFGQYNGADWPGKLHDEREFPERMRAEEEYFRTHPPLPDRDPYGGWLTGPRLGATGRFRVAKHDGKWWLIDPDGRLFWSNGIDCVRFNAATIVAGREFCFEWLPEKNDPLARFYSGRGRGRKFDFFQANAFRKYGEPYAQRFFDVTMRRFQSWGINTIANWSSPDAWRLHKVPYTIPVHVPRVPMFVATSHRKAGKEKKKWFPDPFDPKFRAGLEKQLARYAEFKDDPWLLGVFIHNELPWTLGAPWRRSKRAPSGIALLCLQKNDTTFAAKRALIDRLRAKYRSIGDLNRAWATKFGNWSALEKRFELTNTQRAKARADLTVLDTLVAEQYFRVCRETMSKMMPGVLYLGCRFSGMYDLHFVQVAKKYCDVVSFNIYAALPSERTVDELATKLDFPVIIGEFHFGALDRGMFHPGLRKAKDQEERAAKYAAYVRAAAAAPWCVGAHWFQYVDQPLTGRPDGENYNIGFVDATDDPYPELRDAVRKVSEHLYEVRCEQRIR